MNSKTLVQSTKWSAITETAVKIASPISNIILARLLTPEVFGLVATYTLVTSFAEIFTDGGFQKFLVQHEFIDDNEREQCTNTAFWTNLGLSILFWLIIVFFKDDISSLIGSPGHGNELAVLGIQILLFGLSSIQQALYKRDFRFKQLAPIRLATSFVPLVVTVPLAYFIRNSWAVIIGYLVKEAINALLLTINSKWKPKLYYSVKLFKKMIRDCLAYMADSFMVWLTAYSGTLVISHKLDSYYLGVYKTGYTTITSYLGIIYGITQPIVFSALSRCQNDEKECNRIYIQYLKYVAYIIIPLGAGMAVFHELVINILLGSDWSDATVIMVCTSLSYPIVMLTGQFNSVYFRAKGKPTIALLVQTIYVIIMILAFIISSNYSFELFSFTAGTVNVFYGVLSIGAMIIFFRFPYIEMFRQWSIVLIATIAMVIVGIILLNCFPNGIGFQVLAAIISAISYLGILLLVPNSRNDIKKVKYIL